MVPHVLCIHDDQRHGQRLPCIIYCRLIDALAVDESSSTPSVRLSTSSRHAVGLCVAKRFLARFQCFLNLDERTCSLRCLDPTSIYLVCGDHSNGVPRLLDEVMDTLLCSTWPRVVTLLVGLG